MSQLGSRPARRLANVRQGRKSAAPQTHRRRSTRNTPAQAASSDRIAPRHAPALLWRRLVFAITSFRLTFQSTAAGETTLKEHATGQLSGTNPLGHTPLAAESHARPLCPDTLGSRAPRPEAGTRSRPRGTALHGREQRRRRRRPFIRGSITGPDFRFGTELDGILTKGLVLYDRLPVPARVGPGVRLERTRMAEAATGACADRVCIDRCAAIPGSRGIDRPMAGRGSRPLILAGRPDAWLLAMAAEHPVARNPWSGAPGARGRHHRGIGQCAGRCGPRSTASGAGPLRLRQHRSHVERSTEARQCERVLPDRDKPAAQHSQTFRGHGSNSFPATQAAAPGALAAMAR